MMYAAKGVTTICEGATHAHELKFLRKAAAQKRFFLDIVSQPLASPQQTTAATWSFIPT